MSLKSHTLSWFRANKTLIFLLKKCCVLCGEAMITKYIVLAWPDQGSNPRRDLRGRDRMVVGFTTTYVICAYHHWCCGFDFRLRRSMLNTTFCDKVCQWLAVGRWFSPGPPVSSTNKTCRHDITEILLKITLNTIKQTKKIEPTIYHTRGEDANQYTSDTVKKRRNSVTLVGK